MAPTLSIHKMAFEIICLEVEFDELAKRITVPVSMDFMSVSSYGDQFVSSGRIKIIKDLDEPIEGRDVIVIEDIIDSGKTLSHLLKLLSARNPKSGGISALPVYALAIWIPTIFCEFSSPKLCGVEWIIAG